MKIEKINDNQIRCTLTREDLAERQIKLSELAYGTEKAKSLFRDLMQQAAYECGFEAEDIPLMIEAIPISTDTIVLIITKVEYPQELDTRFSQFSQYEEDENSSPNLSQEDFASQLTGADDVLELFRNLQKEHKKIEEDLKKNSDFVPLEKALKEKSLKEVSQKAEKNKEQEELDLVDITKLFVFDSLDDVSRSSYVLKGFYKGCNILYKNEKVNNYYLLINKSQHTPEEFNKVCNILLEYSKEEKFTPSIQAYFEEHYKILLKNDALQTLSSL